MMPWEGYMASDPDKIDEIADAVDDVRTTVDELGDDPPDSVKPSTLQKLHDPVDKAADAADELEDTQD